MSSNRNTPISYAPYPVFAPVAQEPVATAQRAARYRRPATASTRASSHAPLIPRLSQSVDQSVTASTDSSSSGGPSSVSPAACKDWPQPRPSTRRGIGQAFRRLRNWCRSRSETAAEIEHLRSLCAELHQTRADQAAQLHTMRARLGAACSKRDELEAENQQLQGEMQHVANILGWYCAP